jgi:hypothetical protein
MDQSGFSSLAIGSRSDPCSAIGSFVWQLSRRHSTCRYAIHQHESFVLNKERKEKGE